MTTIKCILLEAVHTPIHPDDVLIGGIVFLKVMIGIGIGIGIDSPTLLRVCGV